METFFVFVLVASVFGISMYQKSRQKEAWKQAADSMGVDFSDGGLMSKMRISGNYRGKEIEAWPRTERRGGGRRNSGRTVYYTVVSVRLGAHCWRGLEIKKHGLGDSVATFFGGDDKEIGHSDFDSSFRIKGHLTSEAKECLHDSDVQSALKNLSRQFQSFKVEGGTIVVEQRQRMTNSSRLTRIVRSVVDCAQTLDSAAGHEDDFVDKKEASNGVSNWTQPKVENGSHNELFPDLDAPQAAPKPEPQSKPESEFGSMPAPDEQSGAVW